MAHLDSPRRAKFSLDQVLDSTRKATFTYGLLDSARRSRMTYSATMDAPRCAKFIYGSQEFFDIYYLGV